MGVSARGSISMGTEPCSPRNGLVAQGVDIHVFNGKRMARSCRVERVAAVGKAEMTLANGLPSWNEASLSESPYVMRMRGREIVREIVRSRLLVLRIVIALVDAPGQRRINKSDAMMPCA